MRTQDWVGVALLVAVGGGAAWYFLSKNGRAQNATGGETLAVAPTATGFSKQEVERTADKGKEIVGQVVDTVEDVIAFGETVAGWFNTKARAA